MCNKSIPNDKASKCKRRLLTQYKSSAKKRKKSFSLTQEDIDNLTSANCAYCGSEPSNQLKYVGVVWRYNGIDRLDSKKGYESGNVVTSCKFCNGLKGRMKWSTWADFINRVAETHGGQKPFPEIVKQTIRKGSWKGF